MFDNFFKAFISLFVAIDLVGAIPIFLGLTQKIILPKRQILVTKAVLTALAVGLLFVVAGESIFKFLGITENDFRIAGGIILFIFAIKDLLSEAGHEAPSGLEHIGVVPLGIPIIMGPASLTTILLSAREFGWVVSLLALGANLVLVWIGFRYSHLILKVIGKEMSQALAKIFSLLLAAIAVMLIRLGLRGFGV
jgi:multiple antibiotic resistance protein